jgi:molybdate transport system permease protein
MESGNMSLAWTFVVSMVLISFLMLLLSNIVQKKP